MDSPPEPNMLRPFTRTSQEVQLSSPMVFRRVERRLAVVANAKVAAVPSTRQHGCQ